MKALFYTFHQNNSGGYFVENDEFGVCEMVIVQATSASEATKKLFSIGDNVNGFNSFCGCCGERWNDACESDGKENPEIYGQNVESAHRKMFRERCFVHYLDGSFKEFKLK